MQQCHCQESGDHLPTRDNCIQLDQPGLRWTLQCSVPTHNNTSIKINYCQCIHVNADDATKEIREQDITARDTEWSTIIKRYGTMHSQARVAR